MLVTGGCSASVCSGDLTLPECRTVVNAGEALDLDTRTWSRTDAAAARAFFHVATSLADGSVLVAGGCGNPDCSGVTDVAQVFDATTELFRDVDLLPEASAGMASVRLTDDRVLVAGGCDLTTCTANAYAFEPASGSWATLNPMNEARSRPTTTLLRDGRVLVAGGCTGIACDTVLASAEIYDPSDGSWTSVGPMATPRGGHWAAALRRRSGDPRGRLRRDHVHAGAGHRGDLRPGDGRFFGGGEPAASARRRGGGPAPRRLGVGEPGLRDDDPLRSEQRDLGPTASGEFRLIEEATTVRAFHSTVMHAARDTVVAIGGCQPGTCSWWNETYDVSGLMEVDAGPQPDTGTVLDSGVAPDTSPTPDAGAPDTGTTPPSDGGCGCTVPRHEGERAVFAWLALAGFWLRRRRSGR